MLTWPTMSRSPSASVRRNVRGSTSGSGPRKWRCMRLQLVVGEVARAGRTAASSSSRWLRPFSSTITDQPAAVSMSATVAPAGPGADDHRVAVVIGHSARLTGWSPRRRSSPGLHVAGEADGRPAGAVAVAAVDRIAVERLARVGEQQVAERRRRPSTPGVALARPGRRSTKSAPSAASPVRYCSCQPTTGPLNSRSGRPASPRCACATPAPRRDRAPATIEPGLASVASANGPPAQMRGGSKRERAEQPVDVVGAAGFARPR